MHTDTIIHEFTRQSDAFNVAPVMRSVETLQSLLDLLPAEPSQRWVEVACGPGLISRGLAPRVGQVTGVDLAQAMLDVGEREARNAGLNNVTFTLGDANSLPFDGASFDGAVTRFSLHHIPVPGRCVEEMARVVRPGGWVAIGDHVGSDQQDAAAWHQEIERLRDPSHWACLIPAKMRSLGERAGLRLQSERLIPFTMEFEEWLTRGTGGPTMRGLITRLLADRPGASDTFYVTSDGGTRTLHLQNWQSLWQRK